MARHCGGPRIVPNHVERMLKASCNKGASSPVEQRQRQAHQRQCRPDIVVFDVAHRRA